MKLPVQLVFIYLAARLLQLSLWAYDPLALPGQVDKNTIRTADFTVMDQARSREIPLRVYFSPDHSKKTAPVVLFSHGLGGSREGSMFLGQHWAAHGYMAVFLQHPGSDTSVWRNKALGDRFAAMKQAANLNNFELRVKDVPAVIHQLEIWNSSEGHPLAGLLDLTHLGMSGHSFGAVTTQAVSGESFSLLGKIYSDPRIKAAIAFSPSAPTSGSTHTAFGSVKIPWLLMTGTKDTALIGGATVETRLAVYPALPAGGKYELVLFNAEHSVFTDRALPGDHEPRNPNHHRVILALSTAFWDAWLKGDREAKAWLEGEGARSLLEAKDRWQWK